LIRGEVTEGEGASSFQLGGEFTHPWPLGKMETANSLSEAGNVFCGYAAGGTWPDERDVRGHKPRKVTALRGERKGSPSTKAWAKTAEHHERRC
jgi:hypothetical protein